MKPFSGQMIPIDKSIGLTRSLSAAFGDGQDIPADSFSCREYFNDVETSLEKARERIIECEENWKAYGPPPQKERYAEILGERRYKKIMVAVQKVELRHQNVMYKLGEGPGSPRLRLTADEWRSWQCLISSSKEQEQEQDHMLIQNVAFAIWGASELDSHIDRLKGAIKTLIDSSDEASNHLESFKIKPGSSPGAQIKAILDIRARRESFKTMLEELYCSDESHLVLFGIVLRGPDDQGQLNSFHKNERIGVDVLVRDPAGDRNGMRRIRVSVPYPSRGSKSSDDPGLLIKTIKCTSRDWNMFKTSKKVEEPTEAILISHRLSRANISSPANSGMIVANLGLALANWVLLLWSTSWSKSICSCCLARQLVAGTTYGILKRDRDHRGDRCHFEAIKEELNHSLVWPMSESGSAQTNGSDSHISSPKVARTTLLCLGIVLSELALSRRITMTFQDTERVEFSFPEDRRTFNLQGLLQKLDGWRQYQEAVEWCFNRGLESNIRPFYAEDILPFKDNIVDPLKDYCDELKDSPSAEQSEDESEKRKVSNDAVNHRKVQIRQQVKNNKFSGNSKNHVGDSINNYYLIAVPPDISSKFEQLHLDESQVRA